jgi:hypothetical protein
VLWYRLTDSARLPFSPKRWRAQNGRSLTAHRAFPLALRPAPLRWLWEAIETAASQESVYALARLTGHITDEMHAMTPDEFREYVAREKGTVGNGGERAGK